MATIVTVSCGNCKNELSHAPISSYIGVSHIECSNCNSIIATELQPFSYYNFIGKVTILLGAFLSMKTAGNLIIIICVLKFLFKMEQSNIILILALVGATLIRFLMFKKEVLSTEIEQSNMEKKLKIKPIQKWVDF